MVYIICFIPYFLFSGMESVGKAMYNWERVFLRKVMISFCRKGPI